MGDLVRYFFQEFGEVKVLCGQVELKLHVLPLSAMLQWSSRCVVSSDRDFHPDMRSGKHSVKRVEGFARVRGLVVRRNGRDRLGLTTTKSKV